jgi:hypothetical protein
MNLHHCIAAACTAFLVTACAVPKQPDCSAATRIADLPAPLIEASGMAASRRDSRIIWMHNDSDGTPMLYAIDRAGELLAEIALPDAGAQFDWEDIAAGPCPAGDCLYIADTGDNFHDRDDRAILRITEPPIDPAHVIQVDRFPIAYPGGPEDTEAIFVMPDTGVYLVTKGRRQPVMLYRYPPPLRPDERVLLEPVQQITSGIQQLPDLVTGADAARDAGLVAIRTYTHLSIYRFDGDTLVPMSAAPGFGLHTLGEPQGEGVAFIGGDTIMLATERWPGRMQPFLSRVVCRD